MKKIDKTKINQIFDYVYNPTLNLKKSDGTIVFGRSDPLVAKKASEVYNNNKTNYLLFTGGIGKDSGILTKLQIPEAKYQAALANTFYDVPEKSIYVEPEAKNGGENCRLSIDKIVEENLDHEELILLSHPTSLRRLSAVMELTTKQKDFFAKYQKVGTDYQFDPENPLDQSEAVAELLRLADWPAKGWAVAQNDLPEDFVQYAREVKDFF